VLATLTNTPGVAGVEVDYASKTATVTPGKDYCEKTVIAALEAVEGQNYSASVN